MNYISKLVHVNTEYAGFFKRFMKTPMYLSQFEHQLSKNGSLASHVFRFAMNYTIIEFKVYFRRLFDSCVLLYSTLALSKFILCLAINSTIL